MCVQHTCKLTLPIAFAKSCVHLSGAKNLFKMRPLVKTLMAALSIGRDLHTCLHQEPLQTSALDELTEHCSENPVASSPA